MSENKNISMEFMFPYHLFTEGSHVVIYGAGNAGKTFYRQAVHDGYVKIAGVVDQHGTGASVEDMQVEPVEQVMHMCYDYVLIAICDKKAAEEARGKLLSLGVYESEIKWDGDAYRRDDFYLNLYFKMMRHVEVGSDGHDAFVEMFRSALWGGVYDHAFPYHLFKEGARVVLYAAGDIGRKFYTQASREDYVEIVGIVDRRAPSLRIPGIPVYSVSRLMDMEFDYVLITIHDEKTAKAVQAQLEEMGIKKECIKWDGKTYSRREFQKNVYFNLLRVLEGSYSNYTDFLSGFKNRLKG